MIYIVYISEHSGCTQVYNRIREAANTLVQVLYLVKVLYLVVAIV